MDYVLGHPLLHGSQIFLRHCGPAKDVLLSPAAGEASARCFTAPEPLGPTQLGVPGCRQDSHPPELLGVLPNRLLELGANKEVLMDGNETSERRHVEREPVSGNKRESNLH